MLEKVKARLEQQCITLSYDQEVPVLLAQSGVNEMSGARNLRRVIVEQVEDRSVN